MGLVCEKEGMARSAGRIFGLLLACDGPYSLEEIADLLQVSKASVSTNARMLEQLGLITRVSEPGDRRDFYRAEPDPWERMLRIAQTRWADMLSTFAEAEAAFPAENEDGRWRIACAGRFHRLLVDESEALIARWRELREPARADVSGR
jgi:DNA-binding transcriptional regulator GbsR (MarR family)